jgi:hypothetical protein
VDVPIGMISQIEKVGGQTRSNISDGAAYGIEIHCKVRGSYFQFSETKVFFLRISVNSFSETPKNKINDEIYSIN